MRRTDALVEGAAGLVGARRVAHTDLVAVAVDQLGAGLGGVLGAVLRDHDCSRRTTVTRSPGGPVAADQLDLVTGRHGEARLASGALAHQLQLGGTILVHGVDDLDADVGGLAEPWDRRLGARTRIDIGWLGPSGTTVLDAMPATRLVVPVDAVVAVALDAGSVEVAPGRAARLPAGRRHRLGAPGGPATVLVLVLPRLTVAELASSALLGAAHRPAVRRELPVDPDPTEGAVLADEIAELTSTALGSAVAHRLATVAARPRASTTRVLAACGAWGASRSALAVRCPLPGGFVVHVDRGPGASMIGGGRQVDLAEPAAALLARWSDGATHHVGARQGEYDLAVRLVQAGLLEPS